MNTTDSSTHGTGGDPAAEPESLADIRRLKYYFVGACSAIGLMAAIAGVATYLHLGELVGQRLEQASLDELEGRAQGAVQAAEETLGKIETLHSESAIEVQVLRRLWRDELSTLGNWSSAGVVDSMYLMQVPEEEGTTLWETNVSTEEYGVATIGTWQMFNTDRDMQCNYAETVDLFMDRSQSTWRIRVTKPHGCDTVRAGVTYLPAAWVKEVRNEDILERVNQ